MTGPEFEGVLADVAESLPAEVWVPEAQLETYAVQGRIPTLAACPETEEQALQLMHLAVQDDWAVVPWGGGSTQGMGMPPEQYDLCLSLERLNGVVEYHPADMVVTVKAGTPLGTLQRELAKGSQWWPIDPPGKDQTVGGLLATNRSGPRRAYYGTARDHVIGMRVLHADGKITKHGGRVVKNVTGYDLNKLHIGALGTLGIILEASIKLRPLPFLETIVAAPVSSAGAAMAAVEDLVESGLSPLAVELISSSVARTAGLALESPYLLVAFEGPPTAVERQTRDAQRSMAEASSAESHIIDRHDVAEFWKSLAQLSGSLWCTGSALPTQIPQLFDGARKIAEDHSQSSLLQVHAMNGAFQLGLVRPPEPVLAERVVQAWRELFAAHGGSLILETMPENVQGRLEPWGEPRSDFFLMQRLKQSLDPKRLLNRGRFVGGL